MNIVMHGSSRMNNQCLTENLTENDIFKIGEIYLNLLNGTFSVEDLVRGMIKTIDIMTTSHTKTTRSNDRLFLSLKLLQVQ